MGWGLVPPSLGHCGTIGPPLRCVSAGIHGPFPKAEKPTGGMGVGRSWLGMEGQLCCSFLSSTGFADQSHGHSCGSLENSVLRVLCRCNSSQK